MRLFLDHDVPERVAGVLVEAGHDVVRLRQLLRLIARAGPRGIEGNIHFA